MSGGVMSYKVIDASAHELLGRLIKSMNGDPATFDAVPTYNFSDTPQRRHFAVRVQTMHMDLPIGAEVTDQDGNWFQLVLHEDAPIEFDITT